MSENISTMSDSTSPNHVGTPTKTWVQFDESDGRKDASENQPGSTSSNSTPVRKAAGSGSQTSTSGVSSARGSVNSLSQAQQSRMTSPEGAQLSVSEIQVIIF